MLWLNEISTAPPNAIKKTLVFSVVKCMHSDWLISHVTVSCKESVANFVKFINDFNIIQVGFSPIFTSVIISTIGLMQGMDLNHIRTKLKNELVDVILTGWKASRHTIF